MNDIVEAINQLGQTSWMDYVQLGATVISIIISALAVFYAVRVPKKIEEEQNKITLFDKRNSVYSRLTEMFYNRPLISFALIKRYEEIKTHRSSEEKYNSWDNMRVDKSFLFEASFLFTASICKKLNDIIELRDMFYYSEKLLEEGFLLFDEKDIEVYYDVSTSYFDWEMNEESDKLKALSEKYSFRSNREFSKNRATYYVFELEKQQQQIKHELRELQEKVLEEIIDEMRIYTTT